ncbi:cytochrome P450 [Amycolatopsis pigmentata]|uniref:Cytochrome P450 n=1 Tax=Amycolatopsis pigmentata TaxID=450801 RepID=A0ABW5G0X9_9PSEU
MFTLTLSPGKCRTVVVSDPEILRKIFAGEGKVFPLHDAALTHYVDVISALTAKEVRRWPLGEPFALYPRLKALSLEVILRVIVGIAAGRRRARLRTLLSEMLAVDSLTLLCGAYPSLRGLARYRRFEALMNATDALLYAEIADRRAERGLSDRHDILSRMLADNPAATDVDLRDQLVTLFLAGYDSTGTAVAWALYEIARRPSVLKAAQKASDDGDNAYLAAVFHESIRLHPVFPPTARTLTTAVDVGGRWLPAGTPVLAAIGVAHSDPGIYHLPKEFRPERFLGRQPSQTPFGGGARHCLGAHFAQAAAVVVLREILRRFGLRPGSWRPERARTHTITLPPHRGALVLLAPRSAR